MKLRHAAWVLGALLCGVVLVRGLLSPASRPAGDSATPFFSAVTLDSVPVARTSADYAGQPLLLNVWATWCDPCREEMPSLQRLYDAYRDRGLRVVAVSIDDDGNQALIREFVQEHGLRFDILHDPASDIMTRLQVRGVPSTYLITAKGALVATRYVEDWSSAANRHLVDSLLFANPS